MPYNRRTYYKISLVKGHNKAEYADKVVEIKNMGLLFATPNVPYNWIPVHDAQHGHFCIFTREFVDKTKSGMILDNLPLFKAGGYPLFEVEDPTMAQEIESIFKKMHREIDADYPYKFDLLRNYVMELIHYGQKLSPATETVEKNASERVFSLFIELLERQFPIDATQQQLQLRNANDYAERLALHVNYLNRVIKGKTNLTTTQIINSRIVKEAKILLKQTEWSISEISYCLGFEEIAHFSNFFKKRTDMSPATYRKQS